MPSEELTQYRKYVEKRLKHLFPIFRKLAKGDLSVTVEIPPEEDEFTEFLVNLKRAVGGLRGVKKSLGRSAKEEAVALGVERYGCTQTFRKLLEQLTQTIDPKLVMDAIVTSLRELVPKCSVSYVVTPAGGETAPIFVYTDVPLSRPYLSSIQRGMRTFVTTLPEETTGRDALTRQLKDKLELEFVRGRAVGERGLTPAYSFVVPLWVFGLEGQSRVWGLFHIALMEKDADRESAFRLAYNVVGAAESALSRIEALIASERARLEDLLGSMAVGVLVFNASGEVVIANPAIRRFIGKEAESITLEDIVTLLCSREGGDERELYSAMGKALEAVGPAYFEEVPTRSGVFEVSIAPIRGYQGGVSGGAIILHDITHLKEIDRMKSEFVSVASHQLRMPLTAMKLFIEMLVEEQVGKLNNVQKEYLDNISQSTEQMLSLIGDLLDISRLEAGRLVINPKLTQFEELIQSVIDETAPLGAPKKCRLTFKRPKRKLSKIAIDQALLRQIIHNLIANAINYSPGDCCKVHVAVAVKEGKGLPAPIEGRCVLISVKDQGIGIPKEAQPRIFEKFFRADNAAKVTSGAGGLGLYVAKMMVEALEGGIWFDSAGAGKGATFYVALPIKKRRTRKKKGSQPKAKKR